MTNQPIYIGMISGTSVDAIDVAAVRFPETHTNKLDMVATLNFEIPSAIRESLIKLNQSGSNEIHQMMVLDHKLGELFAEAAKHLIEKHGLKREDIQAIASHGQTVRHQIESQPYYTVQIGNAHVIADSTGLPTVSDFRTRDMVAGGQGAPLVPAFHEHLFKSERDRIILNIGGMANVSFLWHDRETEGFDTGPGNVLMDSWIKRNINKNYDKNGEWAASGKAIPSLLDVFKREAYFSKPPPKSTGRDLLDEPWLNKCLKDAQCERKAPEDVQATLLKLTSETIADAIENWGPGACEVFICGGGAHNQALKNALQQDLPKYQVDTTDALGLAPDWVEACAFAWLGKRCIEGLPGNLPSVTGASKRVILGSISPA